MRGIGKKKGQEEVVGFVMIVVLVSIVFLIFLGIFIRRGDNGATAQESIEVFGFLESMMQQTTDCAIGYEPDYSKIGDLLAQCHSRLICTSGTPACNALNASLMKSLELGWQVGADRPIKGYVFTSMYESSVASENQEIISISKGNCSAGYRGAEYLSPAFPGSIVSTLKICT